MYLTILCAKLEKKPVIKLYKIQPLPYKKTADIHHKGQQVNPAQGYNRY